jgi:hypothetical protein
LWEHKRGSGSSKKVCCGGKLAVNGRKKVSNAGRGAKIPKIIEKTAKTIEKMVF